MTLTRRFVGECAAWFPIGLAMLIAGGFSEAKSAENVNLKSAADAQLKRVLQSEAAGQLTDRDAALGAVLEKNPNHAPARWQSGYVKWKGQWLKFDDQAKDPEYRAALAQYSEARAKAAPTVAGQLALADWCRKHHLEAQERAHLAKVIELDPEHSAARGRLGFINVGGTWYTKQELVDSEKRTLEANKAITKLTPQLKQILAGLGKPGAKERAAAEQKLKAITEPAALPALEAVFIGAPEDAALKAVDAIARLKSPEAAVSLAKFAILNPFNDVGLAAGEALKGRSEDSYVPPLLALLSTPIETRFEMYQVGNRLMYRQMFFREADDHRELFGLTHTVSAQGGNGELQARAITLQSAGVRAAAADQNRQLAARNADIAKLNKRVTDVLSMATGEKLPSDAQTWWKWWNDRNEVFLPEGKPLQSGVQSTNYVVNLPSVTAPPLVIGSSGGGGAIQTPSSQRYECLVAGTPIWTSGGPIAVEKLQPGDQVLAQNLETGELSYQGVQSTTTRPAGPVYRLDLGDDTIRASGGHPFWVVGKGWVLTRKLEAGMKLHTPCGAVELHGVEFEEDAKEVTYNLIAGESRSYFVGASKVLSHDNTIRRPTSALVPGLVEK